MISLALNAAIALLAVSVVFAQSTRAPQPPNSAETAYLGHEWTGLLVPAACKSQAKTSAGEEAAITTTGRTTTPAVDESGTRGQAGAVDSSDRTNNRSDSPRLGDVLAATAKPGDSEWSRARKQAELLGPSCRVTSDVREFALVLPDGRMLLFDGAANATIGKRVSGAIAKPTIFRVHVVGKAHDGKVSVDTVQM
jgi:hypothetical protein